MHECLNCRSSLEAARLSCRSCGLSFEGTFQLPRLARLTANQQQLVEQMVLAAGNLKEVAKLSEVSYPTLRKRIDGLVHALKALREKDEQQTAEILDHVEKGKISAEAAARLIRALHGKA